MCVVKKSDLGAASDGASWEANRWSPADVSHPVTVSFQLLILLPLTIFLSGDKVTAQTWSVFRQTVTKPQTGVCDICVTFSSLCDGLSLHTFYTGWIQFASLSQSTQLTSIMNVTDVLQIKAATCLKLNIFSGLLNNNILPEFDQVVAASGNKAFDVVGLLSRRLIDQAAGNHRRSPAHCVTADLQESYKPATVNTTPTHTGDIQDTGYRIMMDTTSRTVIFYSQHVKLTVCALLIFFTSHCWSPVNVRREIAPSELPQARMRPNS